VVSNVFLKKKPLVTEIAARLIKWKHSGFGVDVSVDIPAGTSKKQEALSMHHHPDGQTSAALLENDSP
jgi:hypothetical protein